MVMLYQLGEVTQILGGILKLILFELKAVQIIVGKHKKNDVPTESDMDQL